MRLTLRRVFRTVLLERRQVADKTLEVSFERPEQFTFQAGQYIQLRLPKLLHADPKGSSRVFSIASSPLDEKKISIAYRETGSGFKRTLRELATGSETMIEGPHGFYTLAGVPSRALGLVAGGIGITPFMSMLRFAAESDEETRARVTLLYSNQSPKSAAYLEELEEMERQNARLSVRKKFGVIDADFVRKNVEDVNGCIWYIAGPPIMVESTRSVLHAVGVDSSSVYFENFIGY